MVIRIKTKIISVFLLEKAMICLVSFHAIFRNLAVSAIGFFLIWEKYHSSFYQSMKNSNTHIVLWINNLLILFKNLSFLKLKLLWRIFFEMETYIFVSEHNLKFSITLKIIYHYLLHRIFRYISPIRIYIYLLFYIYLLIYIYYIYYFPYIYITTLFWKLKITWTNLKYTVFAGV